MRYLVIAEKPDVARAIEAAIKSHGFSGGRDEYRVTAASGHLMTLKAPEEYDSKYANWSISDLPIAFKDWELVPKKDTPQTKGMIAKKLADINDGLNWCDTVIHAGDPDAEGQLIVDELLEYFKCSKKVLRLDVNDSTVDYIAKRLKKMEDNTPLKSIGRSAYARTVADALFGFNFTRYYTCAYDSKTPLSIGRVQTPTLGLVVNRDRLIENHVQQTYYVLEVTATDSKGNSFKMTYKPDKDSSILTDGKVLDAHAFDKIIKAINGQHFCAEVSKETKFDSPPLPFNLVELQAFCSNVFGLHPTEVHEITQRLRSVAGITYNRSSCRYLHEFQQAEAPSVMPYVMNNLGINVNVDYSIKSRCFNDKFISGEPHHAIIPTAKEIDLSALSADEVNVYKAISAFYIAQFLPPRERLQTSAVVEMEDGNKFSAVSSVVVNNGFHDFLYGKKRNEAEPDEVNKLEPGRKDLIFSDLQVKEKKTEPPSRYTFGSLLKDMTSVGSKYVTDPRIKALLMQKDSDKEKENGSIGTPATRDAIVETLLRRGYVKETGKGKNTHLVSTEKGRSFFDAIPDSIKSANVTAEWWKITDEIQKGIVPENALYDKLVSQISDFLNDPPPLKTVDFRSDNSGENTVGICPVCSNTVKWGKYGGYCSSGCGFSIGTAYGKSLTRTQVESLLSGKEVSVSGIKSKTGNMFTAILVPSGVREYEKGQGSEKTKGYSLNLDLKFNDSVLGTCPSCGNKVVSGPYGNYCAGKCGFSVPKFRGKELLAIQIKALLDGETIRVKGFKSQKDGSLYSACLTMDGVKEYTYTDKNGKETIGKVPNYIVKYTDNPEPRSERLKQLKQRELKNKGEKNNE